jgi:hypothetical protein
MAMAEEEEVETIDPQEEETAIRIVEVEVEVDRLMIQMLPSRRRLTTSRKGTSGIKMIILSSKTNECGTISSSRPPPLPTRTASPESSIPIILQVPTRNKNSWIS